MGTPDATERFGALAALIGRWAGAGHGVYPTIEPFDYTEEIEISDVGRPFLSYVQRTRDSDGMPKHAETGYLRVPGHGAVEWLVVHPTGIAEVLAGTIVEHDGAVVIEMASTVTTSPTAKSVTGTWRRFELRGDELTYTVDMAAVGLPRNPHLSARLLRGA